MNEKKTSETHLGLPLKQVLPVRLWATPCLWSCSGSETHRCCVDSGRSTCVAKTLKIYEIGLQHTTFKCKLRSFQQSEASNCQSCIVKTTLDGQPPQTALFLFCLLPSWKCHPFASRGFGYRLLSSFLLVCDRLFKISIAFILQVSTSCIRTQQYRYRYRFRVHSFSFIFIHFHSFFIHFLCILIHFH